MYRAPTISSAASKTRYSTLYNKFRGVDFASDPMNVHTERSPMAPNLRSDASGYPEKRTGWRTLHNYGAQIRGIHRISIGGVDHIIVHAGQKLYKHHSVTPTELYTVTAASGLSSSVVYNSKLWILTGAEYLVYDGTTVAPASDGAHAPLISINCNKATGEGTSLEPVNLLTGAKRKSYRGDGDAKDYIADPAGISSVDKITVNDVETSAYTVTLGQGKVTFTTAPGAPAVDGQDNVVIWYTKTTEGYADKINKCRYMGLFGLGGADSDRVFFTGNPDSPNVDWHCDISYPDYAVNPAYVPDTSYAHVGTDNSAVMGYRRYGAYQLVIKEQNDQDATIFLRSAALDADGRTMFGLEQGAAGVGAVSPHCFANLGDDPLLLSKNGVFGVQSTNVSAVTNVKNRSFFVDKLLTAESDLKNAVAAEWNGNYVVCVNGRAYVLDSRQRMSYAEKSQGSYQYECFYWTNIPARCLCEVDGTLYFGTSDGRFCRFSTDIADDTKYNDDGEAIDAFWSTRLDNDGQPLYYKSTMSAAVVLKPNTLSSVKVYITTEQNARALANTFTPDMFDFSEVDFEDFSFDTGNVVQTIPLLAKIRKYVSLQIVAQNDTVNESFGISQIAKEYVVNSRVKFSSGGVLV